MKNGDLRKPTPWLRAVSAYTARALLVLTNVAAVSALTCAMQLALPWAIIYLIDGL